MEQLLNTYDLSGEQQNTAALLERLLGRAIANRYVDFCRLAAGAFALHVSRPCTRRSNNPSLKRPGIPVAQPE